MARVNAERVPHGEVVALHAGCRAAYIDRRGGAGTWTGEDLAGLAPLLGEEQVSRR